MPRPLAGAPKHRTVHVTNQIRNPFRPPSAIDSRQQRRSIAYILACLLWCSLAVKMIVLRPTILSLFDEFGIELPALTAWLLNPAQNVFFVVIAVGVLSAGIFVRTAEGRRRIGRRALVLAFVVVALLILGVGIPLFSLMRALS